MMVELGCPTWKLFVMFGDEYSITTFLPAPDSDVFVPILWLTRRRVICELVHLRQHSADKRRRLEHKVQECLVVRDRLCQIVRLELRHSAIQKRRKQTRVLEGFIISQVSGSNVFCTHLIDDCLCKNVDFTTWQTEAGKGDRKIDASLAIVDTLVDLLDSKGGKASATRFAMATLNESNTAREGSVPGTPGNVGNLNGMALGIFVLNRLVIRVRKVCCDGASGIAKTVTFHK
jgi:hypothetical protein